MKQELLNAQATKTSGRRMEPDQKKMWKKRGRRVEEKLDNSRTRMKQRSKKSSRKTVSEKWKRSENRMEGERKRSCRSIGRASWPLEGPGHSIGVATLVCHSWGRIFGPWKGPGRSIGVATLGVASLVAGGSGAVYVFSVLLHA